MSSNVDVIALQGYENFSVLQSSIHDAWARRWSSRLETRLKYSNGNAFETFPFPHDISFLMDIGVSYLSIRDELMRLNGEGLTKTYNRFHDPREKFSLIECLRLAHREIDRALADAYGWVDLDLGHDFHEVSYLPENDRVRFTISEPARIEALRRLSELNRQRYEEEVAAGLHGSTASRSTARAPRERRAASADAAQPTFNFDGDAPATKHTADPAAAILSFLASRIGWHAKADVLAATSITDGQWNAAITDLVAGGKVERQGERRGARYRATAAVGAAQ
ncbi:type IIL restriction-modification enzyme MmeI [Aquabacterium commune]|uniref:type IIL restriction-modification enzyme MmeI n=1 Tax=Aquabacterium commune TaxID=70586 RepID=UPI00312C9943